MKKEITRKEYQEIIDEIIGCSNSLKTQLGEYPTNSINRLIEARIKLNNVKVKIEK